MKSVLTLCMVLLFSAVSIAQKDSSANLTNSINISAAYSYNSYETYNINLNYSLQYKIHEFSIGPTFLLFPDPYWGNTTNIITLSGLNFNYKFYPFRKYKNFDLSILYDFNYQHYYKEYEDWNISYNSFMNQLGFNNKIKLLKHYYVNLSIGIGKYSLHNNFHDFSSNKKSTKNESYWSGIIKFGIGYNFN